jgi:hypothetical protein
MNISKPCLSRDLGIAPTIPTAVGATPTSRLKTSSHLAHGFKPVKARDWQAMQTWLEQQFMPMLLAESARVGIKTMPQQLPDKFEL